MNGIMTLTSDAKYIIAVCKNLENRKIYEIHFIKTHERVIVVAAY